MLAIIGFVIAFTLAEFSAGLAHDGVAFGGGYSLDWQHGFPVSTASPTNELRFDCLLTLGPVPASMSVGASSDTLVLALPAAAVRTFYSPPPRTRKVSLHLFDSILLI